ncbi:hypothetical protein J7E88_17950 [Streptomyces sp. ISL-10]|uniref:hypothetical protein n=1 Tax=Streptomyces sp. ISL-10 TaxID=2819172 RepID=UPI001BE6BEEF|nr:hypothetical protein [Streptomyces sp. ISL-10]MBT2367139.1 hypothetical protein [Streptomyces sp. ISL-10]
MLNQRTSAALSTATVSPDRDERVQYVAGLRGLADWLERSDAPVPAGQRLLLPLHSNAAVEIFAAEHDLVVVYDGESNASADLQFGGIVYHAYGYVDFDEHCARANERQAQAWASEHGLVLRPADEGA